MSEENKALFRRFVDEVITAGDVDKVDQLMAPDFAEHEQMPGMPADGREAAKWFINTMRSAFSGFEYSIEDLIAEGDRVVARAKLRGTHTGEFMGIPPTSKPFEIDTIDIVQMKDGKAVAHWGVTDAMAMMQQLGVMEAPPG